MAAHDVPMTASQLMAGGPANGVSTVSVYPDWQTFGAKRDEVNADAAFQEIVAGVASNPDAPFLEDAEIQMGSTIDELNEGIDISPAPPGSITEFMFMDIAVGGQPKAFALIKEIKAAIRAAGGTPGLSLLAATGQNAGQIIRSRRFASWSEYGAMQQAGIPTEIQALFAKAAEDRDFPFIQPVATMLTLDITDQL